MKTCCTLGLAASLLLIAQGPVSAQSAAGDFDARTAFCERDPFVLSSMEEVTPCFDYASGLRTGRTAPPSTDCSGSTFVKFVQILSSPDQETGLPLRDAFLAEYAAKAMVREPGEERYLADVTLASLTAFLCPGEMLSGCIEALPEDYRASSPVFCDFADVTDAAVKPEGWENVPLLCSGDQARWLQEIEVTMF